VTKDADEYKFWIDAYSPDTIPMQRLGEYMAELGKLLAFPDRVHFHRLEKGSTGLTVRVEREAAPKVKTRLESIKRSEAANDAIEAVAKLNDMLRDDNAVAELRIATQGKPKSILRFPGREIPKPQEIGPFSEPASIKAQLYRIGGRDETAHAQLLDTAGRQWNGDLTQEQAAEMAAAGGRGLYRWFTVNGTARWLRTEDNQWKLVSFHIHDFKLLPETSLEEELKSIRNVQGSEWKETPDPLRYIEDSRKDDDEIH
jgi:hypothetical protein